MSEIRVNPLAQSTITTIRNNDLLGNSMLSTAMDNTTQHDFVLQTPEPGSRYHLQCRIYFFDTPKNMMIEVGYNELSRNVIKHIMTLYRHNTELNDDRPLEFPDAPERYSPYMIDDDESEHAPDYDMGARNVDEPVGEFPTLAFIVNKNFKKDNAGEGADANLEALQTEEER